MMQNNYMDAFRSFMQIRNQYMKNMNIPNEIMNDPNGVIQYMLNTGRISQAQYNQAKKMADSMPGLMR